MSGIVSPSPGGCLVAVHGSNGTNYIVLKVDASGQLYVVASSLPLPSGAATEATLSAINGKLPSSLASDRLKVDGSGVVQPISATSLPLPAGAATENTLSAVKSAITTNNIDIWVDCYAEQLTGTGSSGQIAILGTQVPSGKRLVICNMFATLTAGSSTDVNLCAVIDGNNTVLYRLASPAVNAPVQWSGRVILDVGDRARCNANGVGSNTSVSFHVIGYYMSVS